ncbi:hypothetical protein [Aquimarina aggregata]|uniref:hypothetical protein n=1 Tax=Aquimarina aggregata TaxID=1642818 RepID=UPI00249321C8|nr:hypothetical protein [Aquimarina aggregata]
MEKLLQKGIIPVIILLSSIPIYLFFSRERGPSIEDSYRNDIKIVRVEDSNNCNFDMYHLIFKDEIDAYFKNEIEAELYKDFLIETLVNDYYEE